MKKLLGVLVLSLFISFKSLAQDCDTGPGLPGEDPDAPTNGCDVPLDTWVYVLVISGAGFGAYQLHRKQKSSLV